jgi:hypothetical protein
MSTTSRVAGAVAAGYALGRFKKLRLAVLVATAMSSPKIRAAAADMLQDRLPGGAITGTITKEVGGRLVNVGKTAATSIVASRIDTLSQNLANRSENLRKAGKSRADESAAGNGSEEPTDEYEEEEAEEPTDEYEDQEGEEAEEPTDEYEEEEAEEPTDEYEDQEGEEAEEPTDEYEEEEAEEPTDEYEDQEGEEAEEPTDEYEEQEAPRDEEPEEPVARSPRRRRSASPAGRGRG